MYHKFIYWWVKNPVNKFLVVHGFGGTLPFVEHETHVPQIQSHVPKIWLSCCT
jgi:hypothetical protein